MTWAVPPAASIFWRALAVKASATMKSGRSISPPPRILTGCRRVPMRPVARSSSALTVSGAALSPTTTSPAAAMAASASAKRPCSA